MVFRRFASGFLVAGALLGVAWWWRFGSCRSRRPLHSRFGEQPASDRYIPVDRVHGARDDTLPSLMDRPENGERPSDQPEPVDDLQRIWGVGPKIAHALTTAGITTFAALASAESDRLRTTLQDGGIRIVDLEPWRQQAALAAAGNFDALEVLQEQLKARRRSPQ